MDFLITKDGELSSDNKELNICKGEDAKVQAAYCICKSLSKDWFIDNLGANLEQILGRTINKHTIDYGKRLITLALADLYNASDLYIDCIQEDSSIIYTVYIKREDGLTSSNFTLTIDLLGYV